MRAGIQKKMQFVLLKCRAVKPHLKKNRTNQLAANARHKKSTPIIFLNLVRRIHAIFFRAANHAPPKKSCELTPIFFTIVKLTFGIVEMNCVH